jgi:galactofuranose transport system permease protein
MRRGPRAILELRRHSLVWPLLTLLAIIIVNCFVNHGFLHIGTRDGHLFGALVDIANRAAPLMLVSLGMTLVIAVRGIDISVGAIVAISAAVAATMIGGTLVIENGAPVYISKTPMVLALLAAVGVAGLCGMWNGALVAGLSMQPIIATLILMVAGRGIAQLLTDGQIVTVYYPPFFFLGSGYLFGLPFSLFIVAFVLAILLVLTRFTALQLFIQSVGVNPVASRLAGLNARALTFWVYTFCGVCAGIAGLIISSNVKSADGNNAGLLLELDAILAVTLGGTSLAGGRYSLWGSVIGALIIQTLTYTIYSIGVPPEVNLVVKAIVVFAVCLMQSSAFRATVFHRGSALGAEA